MELATIIRRYAGKMLETDPGLLPNQRQALVALAHCRTPACGEMVVHCPSCGRMERFAHSCGNRFCPKCQHHETTVWLERQRNKLLPVPYFLVTFTLPAQLRPLAYGHQRVVYDALFKASSEAMRELAAQDRFLAGDIGMTGVLHTNNRRMDFHPHTHFIVPGGGYDPKKKRWKKSLPDFLVRVEPLSRLFRGKFLARLIREELNFPHVITRIDWNVNVKPAGQGEKALQYLARYLYRGVISERSIVRDRNGEVTFSYLDSKTRERKTRTLPGVSFLRLLLAHVLPKGFRRARDYGFLHGRAKKTLAFLQLILRVVLRPRMEPKRPDFQCAKCGHPMKILATRLPPQAIRGSPLEMAS